MRQKPFQLVPIVSPEEIGFAMSIFVGAANMRIPKAQYRNPASAEDSQRTDLIDSFRTNDRATARTRSSERRESTLDCAFGVLWNHYEGSHERTSICARVLAFHNFMTGRNAGLLERWLQPCAESLESVMLDPAIVEAVASVALTESGPLCASLFMARIEALSQLSAAHEAVAQ